MCSSCALKMHNGHDVKSKEDFATEENRVKSSVDIDRCKKTVDSIVKIFHSYASKSLETSNVFFSLSEVTIRLLF